MAAARTTDPAPVLTKTEAKAKAKRPPKKPVIGCAAVEQEARKYSGWNINIVQAISHAESHCNVNATGDGHLTYYQNGRKYGYSLSAMQVRILPGREHCDAHNLRINIKCAYAIWRGSGYGAWTMYNNGEYWKYLK